MANQTEKKSVAEKPSVNNPRAKRPVERTPVHGSRDILTVRGKRNDLVYRWVLDKDENGQRIFMFKNAGYEFVQGDEVQVGQSLVYDSENVGSIVRVPDKAGGYMFLMAIPKDWYEEDQMVKQHSILSEETNLIQPDEDEGQYGSAKIRHEVR